MYSTAKITSKGQITMPKKIREFLELKKGDTIIFELRDSMLFVRKSKTVESFFSTLPPLKVPFKKDLPKVIAENSGRNK